MSLLKSASNAWQEAAAWIDVVLSLRVSRTCFEEKDSAGAGERHTMVKAVAMSQESRVRSEGAVELRSKQRKRKDYWLDAQTESTTKSTRGKGREQYNGTRTKRGRRVDSS